MCIQTRPDPFGSKEEKSYNNIWFLDKAAASVFQSNEPALDYRTSASPFPKLSHNYLQEELSY
jgi:hypothetical protein